ncbi:MAG: hypothetical protein H6855_05110 [Rhodospirillales bacterium]|nr:hypothetical protein [Rhodospirillales bacterium]MCB9973018.1 hypothetical protein [Rhodospirillales bacterium]
MTDRDSCVEIYNLAQKPGHDGSFQIIGDLFHVSQPQDIDGTFSLAKTLLFDTALKKLGLSEDIKNLVSFFEQKYAEPPSLATRERTSYPDILAQFSCSAESPSQPDRLFNTDIIPEDFHGLISEQRPQFEPELVRRDVAKRLPFLSEALHRREVSHAVKNEILDSLFNPHKGKWSSYIDSIMSGLKESDAPKERTIYAKFLNVTEKLKVFGGLKIGGVSFQEARQLTLECDAHRTEGTSPTF